MVNTQQTITIPLRPSLWNPKTVSALAVLAALGLAAYQAGLGRPGVDLINLGGWPQLREFLVASLRPDLSPEFVALMGRAALVTLAYAVLGTALSVGLGIVGGLLSSAVWWQTVLPGNASGLRRSLWLGVRGLLAFPRAIHELIWGLVLLQVLGLNPLVGVLAIAIPFGAIVAKVFSEILDETPPEPLHALLNAGTPPLAAFVYGLLPQALPNLLSYTFYRFECSLRASAVLGIIGAGGLGYEIFLSLQSLRYEQLWTGFYALIVLNGAVDAWSAVVRRRMGFTSRLDINRKPGDTSSRPAIKAPSQDWFLRLSWMGAALAIPLSWWWLRLDVGALWSARTQRLLGELLGTGWPPLPSWSELVNLARLSWLTVAMSMVAIALAGLGGILFSLPAAQNFLLPGGLLRPIGQREGSAWVAYTLLGLSRMVLLVSRAIPAPIWALVLLYMLFPGVLPGALALALHNFGILGRLMAEVNENLDDRPVRALSTLGASPSAVVAYGILPQNLGRFLAYILYRWEVCLRETVIVGLVGAGGLGRLLTEQISSFDYSGVTITLGVFVVLTFGVDAVSQRLRGVLRE
ncbi:ABC transporter permease subunit [Leptolyngbya sp. CCNP1308]|uniref:PhnE/PtxC family ABC transporter permease n=1 Tax=Leptolyngbya sp. CCNP1308 TaxID=3110255 RepID=UPI002B218EA9|nr:ABC transporter permease subunit [Leptolyngbya sp. CCNP1308]MEA5450605.1 ABC transporter permease subunit [Leptolyngbya sp. CCNP1308]